MRAFLSFVVATLLASPSLAELVVPGKASEPRIDLWIVVVVAIFLVILIGFGALLSSRRTHQD